MTPIFIIVFLALAVTILFAAHYFLYFTTVVFFSITNTTHRTVIAIGLVFLATSYFLSAVLNRLGDNFFTRAFYFLSGFWLGLLLNLLMAMIVAWVIVWASRLGGSSGVNTIVLGTILFSLSIIFSFYGVWNSMNPQLKHITVSIPNLPESWKGQKIVQLSDIHLGHIYRAKFMRSIVKKVNSVDPKMVLITGDLFDGMDGDLDAPIKPLNDLNPQNGIYFITGNHETYLGLDNVFACLKKTNVKIISDRVVDVEGLKLIGVNYPNRSEKKNVVDVVKSLEPQYSGQPNIFMYHSPVNIDQFSQMGINLQLSGHTHDGQLFPLNYITKLIYHGYDYGLHKIGDYTLYTSSGTGAWGPTMRTGNKPEIVVITFE
jgi:uncharacterized protein